MALLLAMIVADDDSDANSGVSSWAFFFVFNELLVILNEWLKGCPGIFRHQVAPALAQNLKTHSVLFRLNFFNTQGAEELLVMASEAKIFTANRTSRLCLL